MISTSASLCSLVFLAIVWFHLWRKHKGSLPLPPGPPGYPLIGNLYDIPQEYAWLTYDKWSQKYGDVMRTQVFGQNTIILNSLKAAIEILDKRSANTSDRPRMVMADEVAGWEWDFAHMGYSDRWRRHRRYFHQYFQPRNLASYYPVQKKVTVNFLDQLLQSPEKFEAHIRQLVGSIVLSATYGYEVKAENDFYIALVQRAIEPLLNLVHPGHYVVDFLPWLKHIPTWLPGASFKRKGKGWSVNAQALKDIPFNNVREAMTNGKDTQSFVSDNLEKIRDDDKVDVDEEAEIIKNCAGLAYLAGSDTTVSVIQSWFLAMASNPEIQRRAQDEVDSVIGDSKLPDFEDKPSMPYVEAMILETMRWGVVTPLALPHRVLQDEIYEGYRIPAGSTVTANVWAILHDNDLYPNPFEFKPERFIEEGKVVFNQPDPTSIGAFGFGRRICPGRYLASNSAWISIASILATYDISKVTDANGTVVEPRVEYTDGLVSHPKSFQIRITPRSERTKKLIDSAKLEFSL